MKFMLCLGLAREAQGKKEPRLHVVVNAKTRGAREQFVFLPLQVAGLALNACRDSIRQGLFIHKRTLLRMAAL